MTAPPSTPPAAAFPPPPASHRLLPRPLDSLPLLFYTLSLIFYHTFELLFTYFHTPDDFGWHSLLLSGPYLLASLFGLLEHLLELFLFPSIFSPFSNPISCAVSLFGVLLTLAGQTLRCTAMITAKQAFTHRIKTVRRNQHQLVTTGVYKWSRHPGYVGWFWWAVGTQVALFNPLATIAYVLVSWRFFKKRIAYEDYYLYKMFPTQFDAYYSKTPTRIWGIE